MTQIKVCGITTIEDALAACAAGADALGFIFHAPSPRCIAPVRAREIAAALPPPVVTVGVFVNRPPEEVLAVVAACRLDMIQLHGDEPPGECGRYPAERLLKALAPRTAAELPGLAAYPVRAFLIDARRGEQYGGTGETADWRLAGLIARRYPLVLAGGLDETNVAAALATAEPDAVDLNSGVERAPGRKDPEKLRRAIARIRAAGGAPRPGRPAPFAKGTGIGPC